jgi:predicted MFS family arabinose efflux permease
MWLMKTRPQDMGLLPDGARHVATEATSSAEIARATANPEPGEYTLLTALRSPTMWSIMVTAFFIGMAITGVLLHEHAFFTDRGISMASAGIMLAVTGGTGGIGKVSFGLLADRILPRHALMISIALQILAVVILLFTEGTAMMWVFVIVFGFGMGGNIAVQPLLTTQFFGLASLGAIFGGVAMALSIGTAVGPFLSGFIFDVLGSYRLAFVIFIVGYVIALAALILARKPKPRAVVS